ncbi:MAG TPA: transglutaminase-like domain-containing protein [Burkholderiales bacterium]|nr:transglutaminase-like domain-containing protein [Burkholderiales bacterium]
MRRFVAVLALAALCGCAGRGDYFRDAGPAPAPAPRTLSEWPWQEIWTGVVFRGQKVGFSRLSLRPAADAPGAWDLESESALRLRFLGVDKRVSLRASDRVNGELQLLRFRYDYVLDGSRLRVEGERSAQGLRVRTEAAGSSTEALLAPESPALPASALALLPALRGLRVGDSARVTVFVGESQSLAAAEIRVGAYEASTLFEGKAYRVTTSLLGLETETWLDAQARPLLETAMHGAMISALEDPARARAYLVEASLAKDETLLDFSRIPSAAVPRPRSASALHVVLVGVPPSLQVPDDAGQRCQRSGERLDCRIDRRPRGRSAESGDAQRYLRPTIAVPSHEGQFTALARSLDVRTADPDGSIGRLLTWIDANIAKEAVDAFSAADVLRERRGECQGHAYLFAALARAGGLPTRVVNGLVYMPESEGFLYHTWNEVWIPGEGWRAVDATFAQPRADATHVALVVGESAAELAPLAALVGQARVSSVGDFAHW